MLKKIAAASSAIALSSVMSSAAFGVLLHSQGPLITNPTGGTGPIAGQPLSTAEPFPFAPGLTATTTGVGATAKLATPTYVADDFTVPAGGWNLDSATFYAFQTGQASPSVTKIRVNLWNTTPYLANSPDLPAGTPVPSPILAQELVLDAGPGTFVANRVSGSDTTTVRPVFSYTVSLDSLPNAGQLTAGTYWLSFSFEGAGTANVFVPLVTPRSSVAVHNGRLLNNPGVAGIPFTWFEGREGFAFDGVGRAYTFPFELGGSTVPEPTGLALAGVAAAGLLARRRR